MTHHTTEAPGQETPTMRIALTAAAGWFTINTLGVLTLAAHNAWTAHRTRRTARRRYTTEAIAEAQQRHPTTRRIGHTHRPYDTCPEHCAHRLEALYLAPAASVNR